MKIRVGFGYDVHRLEENRSLVIGGVRIDHEKGAAGHSDADVLIHALCDALLGAAGLRDIGHHFPDTDPRFKGADSKELLSTVVKLLSEKGYSVVNADTTLCLQRPKVAAHIPAMIMALSSILGTEEDAVSIKATTNEKIGFVGREEGVAAYAVVLVLRNEK